MAIRLWDIPMILPSLYPWLCGGEGSRGCVVMEDMGVFDMSSIGYRGYIYIYRYIYIHTYSGVYSVCIYIDIFYDIDVFYETDIFYDINQSRRNPINSSPVSEIPSAHTTVQEYSSPRHFFSHQNQPPRKKREKRKADASPMSPSPNRNLSLA
jgi:hypothetical protein